VTWLFLDHAARENTESFDMTKKKRFNAEQVVALLRQIEVTKISGKFTPAAA
jgi:hypothetical protein